VPADPGDSEVDGDVKLIFGEGKTVPGAFFMRSRCCESTNDDPRPERFQ
jgi:hypothetical protein